MKRWMAFALVVVMLLSAGCAANTYTRSAGNVLYAWSGEYTPENWKGAIAVYRADYTPFVFETEAQAESVTIETDFEVESCSVPLLSPVNDHDATIELERYIDLAVETACDGNRVTISTAWWCSDGGFARDYPVWSYLVRVRDREGEEHYYYFRADYSALAKE